MRRFLLGILIVVLTLGILLGVGLLLADRKPEEISQPVQTTALVTEAEEHTVPTEAETLPMETEAVLAENAGTYDTVPLYFQTDYPYIKFGNGTMATSGCSVTCLAMVATYLTDREYTPPQMAYHFGSYGKTNIERLDHGIAQMQLPYQRTENIQEVFQALRSGKVTILMMDEESVFTSEQHFIVVAGMNKDGKFIVNDPIETHYTKSDVHVRNGYENGFADYHLSQGFSGGWIFDKAAMPEQPFLFDASIPEQKENRYEGYTLTDEDIYTLACFVWAEAREEPPEVKQAVAEVEFNRLVSGEFGDTLHQVIFAEGQFRSVAFLEEAEAWQAQYDAIEKALEGPYVLPMDVVHFATYRVNDSVWGKIGGHIFCYEEDYVKPE